MARLTPGGPRRPGEVLRIAHRALELGVSPDELSRQGAHLVEIDVRTSADDAPVVWHDAKLPGSRGWVYDVPARELPPPVVPLPDVLRDIAAADLGVYADVKALTARSAERLANAVEQAGLSGRCVLASSRTDIVAGFARLMPDVPRAVLFGAVDEDPLQLATSVGAAFAHPCWERFAAPHEHLDASWLARLRARGIGVITWHEERPAVLRALLDLGVDGICTDDVPALTALAGG